MFKIYDHRGVVKLMSAPVMWPLGLVSSIAHRPGQWPLYDSNFLFFFLFCSHLCVCESSFFQFWLLSSACHWPGWWPVCESILFIYLFSFPLHIITLVNYLCMSSFIYLFICFTLICCYELSFLFCTCWTCLIHYITSCNMRWLLSFHFRDFFYMLLPVIEHMLAMPFTWGFTIYKLVNKQYIL